MDMNRRGLFGAAAVIAGATASKRASACSLIPPEKQRDFNDVACRQQISELVTMFNQGPSVDSEKLEAWTEARNIEFSDELLGAGTERIEPTEFIRTFKISGGKLDTKPIRLLDVEIIQQRANLAAYAFTLRRYSYTPADPEGCNGLFTHDEFWQFEKAGYIAAFKNNKMQTFRPFPEWFAEA